MKKHTGFTPLEMLVKRMKAKKISLGYCGSVVSGTQNRRGRFLSLTGFTLMELMIVIAIIMILSGAIVARIGTGSEKAKIAKATAEMNEIASAARAFRADTGVWPAGETYADIGDGGLINKDRIANFPARILDDNGNNLTSDASMVNAVKANWRGPYLEATIWPNDPWGSYYLLSWGSRKQLTVVSCGPDKVQGTRYDDNTLQPDGDNLVLLVHKFWQ